MIAARENSHRFCLANVVYAITSITDHVTATLLSLDDNRRSSEKASDCEQPANSAAALHHHTTAASHLQPPSLP
jgi:hypothetical protein